jgi:predicted Zn-dependent protease
MPWEFTLLDSDTINAFALPGGKVFFSRGLAERMTNEAQMAGVLGHEIGHVTAQHSNQRISHSNVFNLVLAGAAVSVAVADSDTDYRKYGQFAVPALAIGGNIVLLKFGRDEELQADLLGVRYMTRVGYDPKGAKQVMELLQSLSAGARQPEFLSTHPDPASRVAQIEQLLQGEYAHTQNNPEFALHEARFQREFLEVIKGLPRPVHHSRADGGDVIAALGPPSTWCAHCAACEE